MIKQIIKTKYNRLRIDSVNALLKKEKTTPEDIPEIIFKDIFEEERKSYI